MKLTASGERAVISAFLRETNRFVGLFGPDGSEISGPGYQRVKLSPPVPGDGFASFPPLKFGPALKTPWRVAQVKLFPGPAGGVPLADDPLGGRVYEVAPGQQFNYVLEVRP